MYAALKSLPAGSIEDEIYSALSIAPNIRRASGLGRNSSCVGGAPLEGRSIRRAGPIYRSTTTAVLVIKSNKGKRDDRFDRLCDRQNVTSLLCIYIYVCVSLSASQFTPVTFPLHLYLRYIPCRCQFTPPFSFSDCLLVFDSILLYPPVQKSLLR